ncbi:MAG TPA: LacI family DNA-binding transcriptional regulator [Polyangiaceae bacterium]|nr:LacI family DNA-binding transcriptional regulator [Polyangiaceae bacterium]
MGVNPRPARRATLKEVAAELGVAPSTVSNAYNRPDQLSPALRERVFEAARQLGYPGPNPVARGLRRGAAGALGVLYAGRLSYAFADPAAVLFLQGVAEAAEEAMLGLLLVSGARRGPSDPAAIGDAAVDGFVVYSMAEGDALTGAAVARRLPVVLVDQAARGGRAGRPGAAAVSWVGVDDEGGARAAAEHVLALGHRRLGVVSLELAPDGRRGLASARRCAEASYWPPRARLRGYAAAVEAAGLAWAETAAVYETAENVPAEGREAAGALLDRAAPPTALLAMSDQLALGALEAARCRGLRVPEDVSVVGFDDVPAAGLAGLTTVHQPHVEKGATAVRLLVAWLRDEPAPSPPALPTRLVVRASTGPPPA